MAFTYDDTLATSRDQVRLNLGDTDSTAPIFSDAEIAYLLTLNADVRLAAALGADKAAAKYARQVDTTNGKLSVAAGQRAKGFRELAAQLRRESREQGGMSAFFGGQTVSGKDTLREDTDAVQPGFAVDSDQLPGNRLPDGTTR